jgi:Fe-S-cluster containining protein
MRFVCVQCGRCCKMLAFPIGHELVSPKTRVKMQLYTARGLKIHWTDNDETLWAVLPQRCRNLTEDNKCHIHENKPELCRRSIGLRHSFINCEGHYEEEDAPRVHQGDSEDPVPDTHDS